jgi:hypothetical protein
MISAVYRLLPKDPGRQVAMVVGASITLGIGFWLAFTGLSQPSGWEARQTALLARADQLDRLRAQAPGMQPLAKGALCAGPSATAAPKVKSDLQGLLQSLHMVPTELSVQSARRDRRDVSALDVRLQVNGDYATVVRAIDALTDFRPTLLVDRADLASQSGLVHFQLMGRVYCRATAQP